MEDNHRLCLNCTCRKLDGDEPRRDCVDCLRINTSLKDTIYRKAAAKRARQKYDGK